MNISLILPAIGKKIGQKYIGTWKMEPLTIAVLKSLIPPQHNVCFFDDRIELIDYQQPTDLVLITVETYTAKRAYQIAAQYRQQGVKVVLGGYHVTLLPKEAEVHADAIICGNAEGVMDQILSDFEQNKLKKRYTGSTLYTNVLPDHSIYQNKKYLPVSLVETGRGCCHNCEFCAIASYYNCQYFKRPIADIKADINLHRHKYYFLADDNLLADKSHLLELLPILKEAGIKWAGQGTLAMAKDPKLLKMMKDSGCELILIGFESLNPNNLAQMHKKVDIDHRDELVERIHQAGLGIYATFIFGYDFDDEDTVWAALNFAEKHKFYTAAFNHLLPFPGTGLYQRLKDEQRLIYDKWWLADDYHYGQLAFKPQKISAEALSAACLNARREFSKINNVLPRGLQAMSHASLGIWSLFWGMNLRIGEEVEQKMAIPIGENLDELPK